MAAALLASSLVLGAFAVPPASAGPRDKELKEKKAKVSKKVREANVDLDESSEALRQATAALGAAETQLDNAQDHLAETRAELAAAEALDRQMQAKLDAAIARLERARAELQQGHELIAEQQPPVSTDIATLAAGFRPEDENADDINAYIDAQRHANREPVR